MLQRSLLTAFGLLLALISAAAQSAPTLNGYFGDDLALDSPRFDSTGINQFAISVAIRDGVALVGEPTLSGLGSAHLYNSKTGELLHTLSPGHSTEWQRFGRTVALEEGYAVVGAGDGTYIYDVNTFELLHTFLPSINYGRERAIDIDNGRILFASGAWNYVFDISSGKQLAAIASRSTSVALSGNLAIIGVIQDDKGPGIARVYDWTTGQLIHDLTPNDMPVGANFGISVAADGNIVVVGAANEPTGNVGSAYIFDLTSGEELHRLEGSRTGLLSSFGQSVAIDGDVAMVAAPRQSGVFFKTSPEFFRYDWDRGAVYAFSVTTGEELARFTSPYVTGGEANFGFDIDYDGRQLIAGTAGWPKFAYVTDFVVPEPSLLAMLVGVVVVDLGRSRRKIRRPRV